MTSLITRWLSSARIRSAMFALVAVLFTIVPRTAFATPPLIGTSTSVTSSASPTVFGQTVMFTATVMAVSGTDTPTGTATFFDGAISLGTGTLDATGVATFATTALSVASHSITASYGGDTEFDTSDSSAITQDVDQADTSTTVMTSGTPSIVDAQVTFTANVTATVPGAGTPTGTVTFFDGATSLGSSPLASGAATFMTSSLSIATHTITAVYAGDTNFTGSTSSDLSQVVTVDGVTVTLGSSLNPSTFGASVTFTATVAAVDSGTGTPTGNVVFKDGTTTLGTMALSSGQATLTTSTLLGGTHTITAVYAGDSNHAGGSSAGLSQVVNGAATTTALGASPNPSVFGQSVTFTATVTSAISGTLTGTVTFNDGATALGTTALSSGTATLSTAALSVASHSITATYNGDTDFAASTSTATSQVVNQASTSTTLMSSSNPSLVAATVTFTATVSATSPGAGTRTGTVTFKDGGTSIGSGSVNGSGVATLATSALAAGSHTITAVYGGDSSFTGSTSSALTQVVSTHGATLAIVAAPNPSVYGINVVLTATATGSSGTPTGTITFLDGTTTLGTGTLNGSGVATLSTSTLDAGTHSITANYGGDGTYATAIGSTSLVISMAATTSIISTSANPITTGTSVTFTANVSAAVTGMSGQIELFDGTTSLGSMPISSGGAASFTTSTLTAGDHVISAKYKGDVNFASSTAAPLTEKVRAPVDTDAGVPDAGQVIGGDDDAGSLGVLGEPAPDTGCGCRVPAESPLSGGGSLLALVAFGALFVRRRSKKR